MSEPKLIIKVELIDNRMKVTLGTQHEALLALALRKAELTVYDILLNNEVHEQPTVITEVSRDIIKQL